MQGWQWFLLGLAWVGALVALGRAFSDYRRTRETLKELQNTIREARAVIEHRGRIADELAHEVRNPLSAIVTSAQALDLVAGASLPESQRQCVKLIYEHGKDLLDLLTSFLELSRIEGGQVKIRPQRLEIGKCLGGTVQLLQASAIARKVELEFACDEALTAELDPRGLKQIVYNLVNNALKFTPAGGKVFVRAGSSGQDFCLVIEDTGHGMTPEQITTLFSDYHKDSVNGNGLGLCIVHRLVGALGGVVNVESKEEDGTRFLITIPNVIEGNGVRKVLWVGEKSPMPEEVSRLLASSADQVAEATEALKRICETTYDTVFASASQSNSTLDELRLACESRGTKFVVARA